MKATEAKELAAKNAVTFEKVSEGIENAAKMGNTMTCMPRLSQNVVMKLIQAGFSVSEHTDPYMGLKSTVIEW